MSEAFCFAAYDKLQSAENVCFSGSTIFEVSWDLDYIVGMPLAGHIWAIFTSTDVDNTTSVNFSEAKVCFQFQ